MSDSDKDEGVLSRWSRRKLAVAQEQDAVVDQDESVSSESDPGSDAAQDEHQAVLTANREAAEAVDLEALTADSDFTVFMKEGVPDFLKKQALAVLWRSNPILANVDGLVDYDDDFGSPDLIMKTFKSAWQAGRGYLKEENDPSESTEDELKVADQDTNHETETTEAEVEGEGEELLEESDTSSADGTAEAQESVAANENAEPTQLEAESIVEEEPLPRVSLRKRLMLDQSS
ncbi:MAG: DUF3306 domain-containing protein [Stappiaceae bacterium]